jgi:hypothetical protein
VNLDHFRRIRLTADDLRGVQAAFDSLRIASYGDRQAVAKKLAEMIDRDETLYHTQSLSHASTDRYAIAKRLCGYWLMQRWLEGKEPLPDLPAAKRE